MMSDDLSRRTMLSLAAILPLAANAACAQTPPRQTDTSGSMSMLVVYFTRSGNTKVIAGTVQRALKADLFEIRPAKPYPEDYQQTVDQAHRETEAQIEPPLAERVTGIARYDTIFLGMPIWGGTAPPIVRSFLTAHDLAGKTIQPFITHGGYGPGDAMAVLQRHAKGANVHDPFVMEADQEKRTINEVSGWLQKIREA